MANESVQERTERANTEAKVLLSVILGFAGVVVLFMVFMMANAPTGSSICPDGVPDLTLDRHMPAPDGGVLNAVLPLHPSLPGSECEKPTYFDVS